VGAEAHLHGAAGIGTRGDRPAEGENVNVWLGHQLSFSDLKKRSASGLPTLGPMKASDTKRFSFTTTSWRKPMPLVSVPIDSTAAAPPISRQSVLVHLPPVSCLARLSSADCSRRRGSRYSTSAGNTAVCATKELPPASRL